MKIDATKDAFKSADRAEVQDKLESFRRELFSLRIGSASGHVKDSSQFKKLRKNIARALTYLKQIDGSGGTAVIR